MTVDDLLLNVARRLRDKSGKNWTGATLEAYLDRAIRQLVAETDPFRRHQIVVPVAGTAEYALASDTYRILEAWYDGAPLSRATNAELSEGDDDWRTTSGTPGAFVQYATRIRLDLAPTLGGTALTWSGAAPITAAQGHTIAGHSYFLGDNSGERFFLPHDATCTNPDASYNLLVRCSYSPSACEFDSTVPVGFEHVLETLTEVIALSDDPGVPANRMQLAMADAARAVSAARPDVAPKRRSLRGEACW